MSASTFRAWALPPESDAAATALGVAVRQGESAPVSYPQVGSELIRDLTERLARARPGLVARPAGELARMLGRVGARFTDPGDPLRAEALAWLPSTSGLSAPMCAAVLDGMARDWTEERLAALLEIDLGGAAMLDGIEGRGERRAAIAVGPSLCVQLVSGSVPGVGVSALIRSLLVKAPTLLKPGLGDVVLPVLFGRALRDADADLAEALAVLYWPGGSEPLEAAALSRADVVVAYGADATVEGLRARTPVTSRFVAYHHRTSVGVVGRAALAPGRLQQTAREVARAVALFDQRGCVSIRTVHVEEGGDADPQGFARALAAALAALESELPSGELGGHEAVALQQERSTAEMLAASAAGVTVHHGGVAPWTVILTADPAFEPACPGGRMAVVRPLASLDDLAAALEPDRTHLQTIGVAGVDGPRRKALGAELARLGASRVVPFGAVPFPSPWWHHDGRGPLADLVRWADVELE